jgi:hypothetical protein
MNAREIIEVFGGQSALADMIEKGQSTVAYWAKTGVIPARWQPKLLMLALNKGLPLTANDFVATPPSIATPRYESPIKLQPLVTKDPNNAPASQHEKDSGLIAFSSEQSNIQFKFESANQAIWATNKNIADLFEVGANTVLQHVQNIYAEEELDELATSTKFVLVQKEGDREVKREVTHYNLDVILSVGYRVNAKKATKFRQWATQTLKAYLEQGYVINEKALRESPEKLNKLAAHIRALRSEEKQIYAKVRECFKISSSDYDSNSKHVRSFFALLQDKFHHAVTGMTGSKLIMDRADHNQENMGLQTMKGALPTMEDVKAGKNYLRPDELYRLHILSEQFLLYAESTALAGKHMTMESLHRQLDRLLTLNDYPVFDGYQDYIRDEAIRHAKQELGLYKKRKKIESLGIEYDEDALADGEYDEMLIEN